MKRDNPFTHDVHARDKSFYRTVLPAAEKSKYEEYTWAPWSGGWNAQPDLEKKGRKGGGTKRDILSNESMKINMCYIY